MPHLLRQKQFANTVMPSGTPDCGPALLLRLGAQECPLTPLQCPHGLPASPVSSALLARSTPSVQRAPSPPTLPFSLLSSVQITPADADALHHLSEAHYEFVRTPERVRLLHLLRVGSSAWGSGR